MSRKLQRISRNITEGLVCIGFILQLFGFMAPVWFVNERSEFMTMGLWEICRNWPYDIYISSSGNHSDCQWIFGVEYAKVEHFISQPLLIAAQIIYTFGFSALSIGCVLSWVLPNLNAKEEYDFSILNAVLMLFSSICSLVTVILLGIRRKCHDWTLDPDYSYFSWSYYLALGGALCAFANSILFFAHAQRIKAHVAVELRSVNHQSKPTCTRL